MAALSPVSSSVRNPSRCSAATASTAESLTASTTLIAPHTTSPTATNTTVSPRDSPALRAAATSRGSTRPRATHAGRPTVTGPMSVAAVTPLPAIS
ncbi:hypothetical protein C1Y40_05822 [Mycobacterium talmoniae]|uniref:Uncharacterized protein n=1 Tax=Mycobacterium talmoniae TaxID=1858794 RepID=A0A2S8BBJ0_9MYCO|nr:hypothetical protein C1Y40_05822 [Mycobacterium talmoniae]